MTYVSDLKLKYANANQNIGLSLNVDEAAWYSDTYHLDLVQLLFTELDTMGIAQKSIFAVPVIVNSYSTETLFSWSIQSNLPTIQSMLDGQDYADVDTYAYGVKVSIERVIGDENPINLNTKSAFATKMHAANLTVHA